jgi:hypothetical protein
MISTGDVLFIGINKMKKKYEARNSKFETNPKFECSKFKTKAAVYIVIYYLFWSFGFRSFEFVSDFDIRISDFIF